MATKITIDELHAGDDFNIDVTVNDSDGTAVDITGATIIFGLSLVARGETILDKDTTNGITITNGPSGLFRIALLAADTANLIPRKYYYEIKVVLSGVRDTVLFGPFDLRDSILK